MNPHQQILEMKSRHVQDGRWCRCGQEYPCDTVILLETYITQPYVLAVQRVYGMGFDTALDFVKKYASRPDQFIVARSIVRAVDEVRGLRDRSYPPDPNEQIVRESTADMGRTLDDFINQENPSTMAFGEWGRGKSHYVPESEFSQAIIVPVCAFHASEMKRVESIVGDRYAYFACPIDGCGRMARVKTP